MSKGNWTSQIYNVGNRHIPCELLAYSRGGAEVELHCRPRRHCDLSHAGTPGVHCVFRRSKRVEHDIDVRRGEPWRINIVTGRCPLSRSGGRLARHTLPGASSGSGPRPSDTLDACVAATFDITWLEDTTCAIFSLLRSGYLTVTHDV